MNWTLPKEPPVVYHFPGTAESVAGVPSQRWRGRGVCERHTRASDQACDLWHVGNQVIDPAPKKRGAYRPYCSPMRDALTTLEPETLRCAREVLEAQHPWWSSKDVATHLRANYSSRVLICATRSASAGSSSSDSKTLLKPFSTCATQAQVNGL